MCSCLNFHRAGIQFGLTGALQRLYLSIFLAGKVGGNESPAFGFADEVLVATAGGMISAAFSSPVELVMIQQQLHGGSIPVTVSRVVRDHGVFASGMGRGLAGCVVRDGIYTAGLLGVTPAMQSWLVKERGCSEGEAGLFASVIGGVSCAVLSHPLDLVKTCLQVVANGRAWNNARIP